FGATRAHSRARLRRDHRTIGGGRTVVGHADRHPADPNRVRVAIVGLPSAAGCSSNGGLQSSPNSGEGREGGACPSRAGEPGRKLSTQEPWRSGCMKILPTIVFQQLRVPSTRRNLRALAQFLLVLG